MLPSLRSVLGDVGLQTEVPQHTTTTVTAQTSTSPAEFHAVGPLSIQNQQNSSTASHSIDICRMQRPLSQKQMQQSLLTALSPTHIPPTHPPPTQPPPTHLPPPPSTFNPWQSRYGPRPRVFGGSPAATNPQRQRGTTGTCPDVSGLPSHPSAMRDHGPMNLALLTPHDSRIQRAAVSMQYSLAKGTRHMKYRGGEVRRHQCDLCEHSFACSSTLRSHRLIHLGQRPFVCPVETCRRGFRQRTHMTRHVRTSHPDYVLPKVTGRRGTRGQQAPQSVTIGSEMQPGLQSIETLSQFSATASRSSSDLLSGPCSSIEGSALAPFPEQSSLPRTDATGSLSARVDIDSLLN